MIAPVFVDTNVLVYARDASATDKHARAREWMRYLWQAQRGRISFQVLHEYYSVTTRKLTPALTHTEARTEVRTLLSWQPQPMNGDLLESAWDVQDRFRLSFWDSLVVAAAQTAGCRYLLTEDLQHGQELDGLTVLSPFLATPAEAA
jgi:predicted nucleic acid-binding protein